MTKPKQTASERDRTLSGQWSKSEKREVATRSIMECNRRTHQINKKFAQQLRMK